MWPDQENLKLQESVIELPVTVRTESDKVAESVHNPDGCIEGIGWQRSLVTNFDVFVVSATNTSMRKGRQVLTPGVLSQPSIPTGRMFGLVGDDPYRE
jgi:hypothetical protein